MSIILDRKELESRIRSFGPDQYKYIYGIMKNVALATGAVVLAFFPRDPATLLPRLVLWLASVAAIMVSHTTAARGILFASFRYNWVDMAVSLAMGVVECLLFLSLKPVGLEPGGLYHLLHPWYSWYYIMAGHMGLAVLLVWNRVRLTDEMDFETELHPIVQSYRSWIQGDLIGAFICGIGILIIGVVINCFLVPRYPNRQWFQVVAGGLIFVVMIIVIAKAERERNELIERIAPGDGPGIECPLCGKANNRCD